MEQLRGFVSALRKAARGKAILCFISLHHTLGL